MKDDDNLPIICSLDKVPKEVNVFHVKPNNNTNQQTNLPPLDTSYVNISNDWNKSRNVWIKVLQDSKGYVEITKNNSETVYVYQKTKSLNSKVKVVKNNEYRYMDPNNDMYTCTYRSPFQIVSLLNQLPIKNLLKRTETSKDGGASREYIYLPGYAVKNFTRTIFGTNAFEFNTKQMLDTMKGGNHLFSNVSTITVYVKTPTHTIRIKRDGCSALEAWNPDSALSGSITNSYRYLIQSFGDIYDPTNEAIDLIKTFEKFGIEKYGVENKLFLVRPMVQRMTLLTLNPPSGIVSQVDLGKGGGPSPYIKKKMIFALCRYVFGVFGYTWSIDNIRLISQNPLQYEVTVSLYIYNEDGTIRKVTVSSLDKNNTEKEKNDTTLKKAFIKTLKQALIHEGNLFTPPKEMNEMVKGKFMVYKKEITTQYFKSRDKENDLEKTKRKNDDQGNVIYEQVNTNLAPPISKPPNQNKSTQPNNQTQQNRSIQPNNQNRSIQPNNQNSFNQNSFNQNSFNQNSFNQIQPNNEIQPNNQNSFNQIQPNNQNSFNQIEEEHLFQEEEQQNNLIQENFDSLTISEEENSKKRKLNQTSNNTNQSFNNTNQSSNNIVKNQFSLPTKKLPTNSTPFKNQPPSKNPSTPLKNPSTPLKNPFTPLNNPSTPLNNPSTPSKNTFAPKNPPIKNQSIKKTPPSSQLPNKKSN